MIIDWFDRALGNRYDSYGYALDHLLVETPHEEAVETNARIGELAVYAEAADRGDYCSDSLATTRVAGATEITPRVLRPTEGEYRK